jgi:sulfopyruvate decarboxylase subunit alpha
VYVPDNPLSHVLKILHDDVRDVRTTIATREEEAFGIAAGLYLGGEKPTVMLQSSGLGNSLNALTSLLVPYQIPALVLISMRGDAGEWNSAQAPMGRAVVPICDAIGLPIATAETPETTAATVQLVAQTAFSTRLPGVCQLPRRLTVPPPPGTRA